ncbi:hypothetical protein BH09BAC5_BH09BAC5_23550 [soil metagenome]
MKIALIGNGLLANVGALYYKKKFPDAEVLIIGPNERNGLPVVGESIIEITSLFMERELGLGEYFMNNHLPKYALTYYFKLKLENPEDRTYSVHCNELGPRDTKPLPGWKGPMARPASWLLNREVFDRDIQKMVNDTKGIERFVGTVDEFDLNSGKQHRLSINLENGTSTEILVDWAIDCTGRNQIFARKKKLVVKPAGQRDCFWFRVEGFDRNILKHINALGPMPPAEGEPYHYDRYYSTHHFLGKGFWIWMIPMKSEHGKDLMSIGFTSHPDYCDTNVHDMQSFLSYVSTVHPVVTDLVKSGQIVDTNLLKRYHYVTSQVYSVDRWAIIGDAAFAPDPLFSNGIAFGTIMLEQIAEMIRQDIKGTFDQKLVDTLTAAFVGPVLSTQTTISNWYATMHDPYLNALRLNTIEIVYFYILLPLVANRCHYDPEMIGAWKVLQMSQGESAFEISKDLLASRKLIDEIMPEHFVYTGKDKVNINALKQSTQKELKDQMMEGIRILDEYTKEVLSRTKKVPTL